MTSEKLHILHTNDIHSHFQQMPYIAGGIRKLKKECEDKGEAVIIVDLGDHADRMSPLTEGTWGQANVQVMNATGYELAAVGNNEGLTFPKSKLLTFYDQANFQVLCANVTDAETHQIPPFMKPYAIKEAGALKIGWISATAAYPVYGLLGWTVHDPLQRIQELVTYIRKQVDVVVVLSHTGFNNDQQLAQEVKGIDLIIGAHTHDLLETGVKVKDTFIIQAGKFGQYLGHTTIELKKGARQVLDIKGICHPVQSFSPASDIERLIEQQQIIANDVLAPSITTLDHDFPIDWKAESPLGNLLAEGIRDWVGSDIAMVNAGQLLFSLPKGAVTRKDLLALCPHPINPCRLQIKGRFIRRILEESLTERSIHRQVRGLGFRGKVLGWLCVDGMTLYYNSNKAEGGRLDQVLIHDEPLDEEKTYSVGTIDMFTFGFIFPQFKEAEHIDYFLPEFIRDVLAKELQSTDALERSSKPRWIHA